MYELNDELKSHVNYGMVVVSDYSLDEKGRLTVILKDTAITGDKPNYLKVIFNKFNISEESFEILGQKVDSLYLKDYVKYFKAQYFNGAILVIKKGNEKITISGGGL